MRNTHERERERETVEVGYRQLYRRLVVRSRREKEKGKKRSFAAGQTVALPYAHVSNVADGGADVSF